MNRIAHRPPATQWLAAFRIDGGPGELQVRMLLPEALAATTTMPTFPPPADIASVIHDAAVSISPGDQAARRKWEQLMLTFARIESGFNPQAQAGSYKGLFQLSDEEFNRHGGGDIFNPRDNAMAAAKKLKLELADLSRRLGRPADVADLYMSHQQGLAGYERHTRFPNDPAWVNMNIASGRARDNEWGKRAIWGNMSRAMKDQFPGGVTSVKSRDFVRLWRNEVEGLHEYYGQFVKPDPQLDQFIS